MRKLLLWVSATLVFLVAAFFIWLSVKPSPVQARGWPPPKAPAYTGILKPNDQLESARLFARGEVRGPDDVAVDYLGRLYTGLSNGHIMQIEPNNDTHDFADTGGRPLGLAFDGRGNLIVADAYKGLLSVSPQGKVRVLTDSYNGKPLGLVHDVDVADDGMIYFSDASNAFDLDHYRLDLLSGKPHGRLFSYNPATGQTRQLLNKLYFANGVAVSRNGDYVLVVESWRYRIRRYWLKGPRAGTSDIFASDLPGFPDGMSSNDRGLFWVALPSRRSRLFDLISGSATLRDIVARLPRSLQPRPKPYGMVLALNGNGHIVAAPQDAGGTDLRGITSVEEVGSYLYLGSLSGDRIGRWEMPARVRALSPNSG